MNSSFLTRPKDIPSLTGLRAFAAWWVVFFHAAFILPVALQNVHWFARLGYLGVDLFFVFSGFIISYNYWDKLSLFSRTSGARFLIRCI
jgi:peptidoglycan/LPS O-acetylase OafA/YrhL